MKKAHTPTAIVTDVLSLRDGIPSFVRYCRPRGVIQGRVLLSHGVSEHGGRYEHVMQALAAQGWASAIADHRGHGRSATASLALTDNLQVLADDLSDLRRAFLKRVGEGPVVLWGHSMGGLVGILHLVNAQSAYSAAVLSAAATMIPPHVPTFLVKAVKQISKAAPGLPLLPRSGTGHLTRDPKMAQQTKEDPLMYKGGMRAATGLAILQGILQVDALAPKLRLPLLITHGEEDKVMPVEGSRRLYANVGSMDKTLRTYAGWVHELHNELGREQYFEETFDWMRRFMGTAQVPMQSASVAPELS